MFPTRNAWHRLPAGDLLVRDSVSPDVWVACIPRTPRAWANALPIASTGNRRTCRNRRSHARFQATSRAAPSMRRDIASTRRDARSTERAAPSTRRVRGALCCIHARERRVHAGYFCVHAERSDGRESCRNAVGPLPFGACSNRRVLGLTIPRLLPSGTRSRYGRRRFGISPPRPCWRSFFTLHRRTRCRMPGPCLRQASV